MNSKEQIIKDYNKIINFVIKKMNLGYRYDDIYDVGLIGFVRGINSYDETKNIKYLTYLYECIKNEILRHINHVKRKKRDVEIVSLNTKISEDTELQDLIGYDIDYEQNFYVDQLINIVSDSMKNLTKNQYLIFSHLYGLNGFKELTVSEISQIYGFSKQSVHQIKNKVLNILRYTLNKYRNEEGLYDKKNRQI